MTSHRRFLLTLVALSLLAWGLVRQGQAQGGLVPVRYPDPDAGVNSFAARKAAQMAAVGEFKVFHG